LKEFLKNRAKDNSMPSLVLDSVRKALPQPEKEEE
jgi:hypothetical protein